MKAAAKPSTPSALPQSVFLSAGPPPELAGSRILIVDDERANLTLLERLFRKVGYTDVVTTTEPRQVAGMCRERCPDLIMLDHNMPGLTGVEVLEGLGTIISPESHVPVVMLTADPSMETKQRALGAGAVDFIAKPFDLVEVLLRVRNHLQVRSLHVNMERLVAQRTHELAEAHQEMLDRLAQAAEFRDDETGQHTRRVGVHAAQIAASLGLSAHDVELMRQAAPLHDVGKIAIPDSILLKPGRLTPEEIEIMKTHTTAGARLLASGSTELFRVAERIALTHHERWDGKGYPQGLKGEEIPVDGQIVALADVYDALTHDRRYRKAWPKEKAVEEIEKESGRHFSPDVVKAFLRLV